jgi:hypothetical protein
MLAVRGVGQVSERELPGELVTKLNELGFVLAEGDRPYTFFRLTMGGEMRLLVQAAQVDGWIVGLASRAQSEPGRTPNPFLSVPLQAYGSSTDGLTLRLTTADLGEDLPRMLEESLLPAWDSAWY